MDFEIAILDVPEKEETENVPIEDFETIKTGKETVAKDAVFVSSVLWKESPYPYRVNKTLMIDKLDRSYNNS